MTILTATFILLMIFQFKHLLADYYWQTPRMYLNKGQPTGWFWPLTEHAGLHALFTGMIAFGFLTYYTHFTITDIQIISVVLAAFDFGTHFLTDRWKATRGRKPDQAQFWIDLGWDQMVHHIVGIIIVFYLIHVVGGF